MDDLIPINRQDGGVLVGDTGFQIYPIPLYPYSIIRGSINEQ
jgi:hypothetical protein